MGTLWIWVGLPPEVGCSVEEAAFILPSHPSFDVDVDRCCSLVCFTEGPTLTGYSVGMVDRGL